MGASASLIADTAEDGHVIGHILQDLILRSRSAMCTRKARRITSLYTLSMTSVFPLIARNHSSKSLFFSSSPSSDCFDFSDRRLFASSTGTFSGFFF